METNSDADFEEEEEEEPEFSGKQVLAVSINPRLGSRMKTSNNANNTGWQWSGWQQ